MYVVIGWVGPVWAYVGKIFKKTPAGPQPLQVGDTIAWLGIISWVLPRLSGVGDILCTNL